MEGGGGGKEKSGGSHSAGQPDRMFLCCRECTMCPTLWERHLAFRTSRKNANNMRYRLYYRYVISKCKRIQVWTVLFFTAKLRGKIHAVPNFQPIRLEKLSFRLFAFCAKNRCRFFTVYCLVSRSLQRIACATERRIIPARHFVLECLKSEKAKRENTKQRVVLFKEPGRNDCSIMAQRRDHD